jgi:hypothetical protein
LILSQTGPIVEYETNRSTVINETNLDISELRVKQTIVALRSGHTH